MNEFGECLTGVSLWQHNYGRCREAYHTAIHSFDSSATAHEAPNTRDMHVGRRQKNNHQPINTIPRTNDANAADGTHHTTRAQSHMHETRARTPHTRTQSRATIKTRDAIYQPTTKRRVVNQLSTRLFRSQSRDDCKTSAASRVKQSGERSSRSHLCISPLYRTIRS